jgi:hypothetical protein
MGNIPADVARALRNGPRHFICNVRFTSESDMRRSEIGSRRDKTSGKELPAQDCDGLAADHDAITFDSDTDEPATR